MNLDDLPPAEFAFPGPLRDQLVAAILPGAKTSTTGLLAGYERENEPLRKVGQRSAVVDSADRRVNALHPFREDNGRAQRAFFGQFARDAPWPGTDPRCR